MTTLREVVETVSIVHSLGDIPAERNTCGIHDTRAYSVANTL